MTHSLCCARCGSSSLARRPQGYRCWQCGALVQSPLQAPETTTQPNSSHTPSASTTPQTSESFFLSVGFSEEKAKQRMETLLHQSLLRPHDIGTAEISPVQLVYLPLWRVDVAIHGFHLGIQHSSGPDGNLRWVLPSAGFRHRDEIFVLPARRFFGIDPSQNVTIRVDELHSSSDYIVESGEVVLADVSREDAAREAIERLRRKIQPQGALYSKFETRIRSAALCHYPLWVQRYRYAGEASKHGTINDYYIALSGKTGTVLSARHPSVFRTALARVKYWWRSSTQEEENT